MNTIEQDIAEIKARNKRVEADKAWETSWARRSLVVTLTYLVIVTFFIMARLTHPWLNALVPALAFIISNSTISVIKTWWLKNYSKK